MHYLKDDVDYERLKVHLSMLPDLIKTVYRQCSYEESDKYKNHL